MTTSDTEKTHQASVVRVANAAMKNQTRREAKTAVLHIAATSTSLRSALIKLAYSQPELREAILPLLKR